MVLQWFKVVFGISFALVLLHMPVWSGATELPPDSAYVVVSDDGHLELDGERVRYWGVIGGFPYAADFEAADTEQDRAERLRLAYASADALIDRFEYLGFNMVRKFDGHPGGSSYTKGDGSKADVLDYFYTRLYERGLRVWQCGLNARGVAKAEDAGVIDHPETAEAWAEAVASNNSRLHGRWYRGEMTLRKNVAVIWDERLEALALQRMRDTANHVNQHNGMRWADDPLFVVWELANEEWFMVRMLQGRWQELPPFFQNSLVAKWNTYLLEKYGSNDSLLAKWGGLRPGENVEAGTVLFAPMARPVDASVLNDANPLYRAETLVPVEVEDALGPIDFSGHRAADVLQFLTEMLLAHKQRLEAALKPMGKGLTLSPMIYDTGRGEGIQMQYVLQQADAVSHDAYINGQALNDRDQWWPWDSGLDEYPRVNEGVPWLEHNRPVGKPFLAYETQIMQPAKYRAEFPLRIASLAAIQDWCAVCWHYWGPVRDIATDDRPFDEPMDITIKGHPQGYHYTYDAVQGAIMRAASDAWRAGHLPPAPKPTLFTFGRASLYDPVSMKYGRAYRGKLPDFNTTTYQHGMRLMIDPSQEGDEVKGPVVKFNQRGLPSPVTPNDVIRYDWTRSSMLWDAPGAISYGGFLARWGEEVVFENGVTLRNVDFHNPEGIAYPVDPEDERYLVFVLTSTDEMGLGETAEAVLTIKSTSFNSGFEFGLETGEQNVKGALPVLETLVSAEVVVPALAGVSYELLDWHGEVIGKGAVPADGVFRWPDLDGLWMARFKR